MGVPGAEISAVIPACGRNGSRPTALRDPGLEQGSFWKGGAPGGWPVGLAGKCGPPGRRGKPEFTEELEGQSYAGKKEREVKAPTGGPCLSGARRARGPDARRWAAGAVCWAEAEAGRARGVREKEKGWLAWGTCCGKGGAGLGSGKRPSRGFLLFYFYFLFSNLNSNLMNSNQI